MKKQNGITIISLVVTIIVLIILAGVSINLILGENGIITKAKEAKIKTEQATLNEEIALNELYMQIEAEGGEGSNIYIGKLAEFKKEIADYIEEAGGVKPEYTSEAITFGESIKGIVKEVTKDATATEDKILKDYTVYKDGELIVGTMTNNGALNATLNAGESYTIPEGYHNGSGKIIANDNNSNFSTEVQTSSGTVNWNGGTVTKTYETKEGVANIFVSGYPSNNDYPSVFSVSVTLDGIEQTIKTITIPYGHGKFFYCTNLKVSDNQIIKVTLKNPMTNVTNADYALIYTNTI